MAEVIQKTTAPTTDKSPSPTSSAPSDTPQPSSPQTSGDGSHILHSIQSDLNHDWVLPILLGITIAILVFVLLNFIMAYGKGGATILKKVLGKGKIEELVRDGQKLLDDVLNFKNVASIVGNDSNAEAIKNLLADKEKKLAEFLSLHPEIKRVGDKISKNK